MEPIQGHQSSRRFGLADILIVMSALALTLSMLRIHWFTRFTYRIAFWREATLELLRLRDWSFAKLSRGQLAWTLAGQIIDEIFVGLLSAVLLGLTLVQPVLRLSRPRPPFREIMRQSGLVACLGIIIGTLIATDLSWLAGVDVGYWFILAALSLLLWPLLGVYPWRPEASWIDRLGRAVGWGWIIATAAAIASAYLQS
jgi:hypothetical protein